MTSGEVISLCEILKGELIETHISWVVLSDNRAYKIKKPVKFNFLDFSSFEERKKLCHLEVELNRRLTNIYLGVATVCAKGGTLSIGGEGKVIEHAVEMIRMPSENRMDRLLVQNVVSRNHISELAKVLSSFHQKATIISELDKHSFVDKRFKNILVTKDFLGEHMGRGAEKIVERSTNFHITFIEANKGLLIERVEKGYKRDLHGDLHSRNIYLNPEPVIFDCIEFDHMYRYIDILSEAAFLTMDLEAFGRKDLADYFLSEYLEAIKDKDAFDERLFHYYKTYRANVRLKVAALKGMQKGHLNNNKDAVTYLNLLDRYTQ